jgi:hypothetical protein
MECKARVDFLLSELQKTYEFQGAVTFVESIKTAFLTMESISMDIELVFRGLLDDIISQISVNEVSSKFLLLFSVFCHYHRIHDNCSTSFICISPFLA